MSDAPASDLPRASASDPAADPVRELAVGPMRLALRPDLGGVVAGLWHDGTPILRSTESPALLSSRKSAMYPLVPYSNRVAYARFRWQGQDYTTRPNFDTSPHSVHGTGWQRPWRVVSTGPTEIVLGLEHPGDADWPFAFEARQIVSLEAGAMAVRMTFVNTDTRAQPVGLGWHPYFQKRSRSRVDIDVGARWDSDATELPVQRLTQSAIAADVANLDFDNCFDGWNGTASIRDERFAMRLSSSLDRLVVFTPRDRDYFCVEPVSHVSNAIHMDDPAARGLRTVEPGASTEAWMRLEVEGV